MIREPRPVGSHGWGRAFGLGLVPGALACAIILLGGRWVIAGQQRDMALLQAQAMAAPHVAERPDASAILIAAITSVNIATQQRSLAVSTVNLLNRIARALPTDVRVVDYNPTDARLELEAHSSQALGQSASQLVSTDTLAIKDPSNEPGSATIYPTATLTWAVEASPAPLLSPTAAASLPATSSATPSVSPSP